MRTFLAGLWRSPDFLRLWTGQTISLLGSHIGGGALRYTAILVLGATPVQLSLLSAAALLPALLLALPAGLWLDRVLRRPVLIGADVGRALLLLSIPLAYALGALRIEQLYAVAALVGVLTILFDTAYPSYVPSVVRRDELVEANSKLSASDSLAEIAGPPLGGALVQALSAPLAVVLDALSFLASALALRGVRAIEPPPAPPAGQPGARQALAEGLAAVRERPALTALLGVAVIQGVAGGIIGTLYDLYLIRELGLTPALVGLTVGAGGISA
ncbi:MAG TPA: MFS transporter, partial [Roseiflexaceae bacterium]|nr:MFS transporter [Roseiflexaceae bacterium]